MEDKQFEYAGFWVRVGATLIDTLLMMLITTPLLYGIYGDQVFESEDFILGGFHILINYIFPFIATVLFWTYRSATPGKQLLKLKVVDAETGEAISMNQSILRYAVTYACAIPLGLGFIWVAFHIRKQGWHDMIAKTVVVRSKDKGIESVEFANCD